MGVGSVLKLANTFLFPSLGLRVVKVRPQTCTQTQTTKHKIKEEVEMQGVKGAQVQLTLNFNGPKSVTLTADSVVFHFQAWV